MIIGITYFPSPRWSSPREVPDGACSHTTGINGFSECDFVNCAILHFVIFLVYLEWCKIATYQILGLLT